MRPLATAGDGLERLVMLPWVRARAALGSRAVRFRLLAPPYVALGVGTLRALRIVPSGDGDGDALEIVAGYDRYERPA